MLTGNIYELGTRHGVTFTFRGTIGIPDLWKLIPDELNVIWQELIALREKKAKASLLATQSKADFVLELKIAIVEDIFNKLKAETEARAAFKLTQAKIDRLTAIAAEQDEAQERQLSREELAAQIAALKEQQAAIL